MSHLEGAATPLDELDVNTAVTCAQFVRQPGGTWSIVSNDAILDTYSHHCPWLKVATGRAAVDPIGGWI